MSEKLKPGLKKHQHLTPELVRRVVEGQVQDFLNSHPTAVTLYWRAQVQGKPRIVRSLSKRIIGDLRVHLDAPANEKANDN
jgi:hypothetical protein